MISIEEGIHIFKTICLNTIKEYKIKSLVICNISCVLKEWRIKPLLYIIFI